MMPGTTVPPERANSPHFVYTLWADRTPLYVGCSNNVERRIKEHRSSGRWAGVEIRVEVFEFPNMIEALNVEAVRIAKLRPAGNIRHNPAHECVVDAMAAEQWGIDYDDLNGDVASRAAYLARNPDTSSNLRRWIAMRDLRAARQSAA